MHSQQNTFLAHIIGSAIGILVSCSDKSLNQLQGLSDPTQIDNFQISPHFTLGRLSKFTPAGSHRLVAQKGLTIPQLGGNLQLIALNCLEPILAKYPDMQVTSGFIS